MTKLLAALLCAVGLYGQSVAWVQQSTDASHPGVTGQIVMFYSPLNHQTLIRSVLRGSSSIYASDDYLYNSATNVYTHLGGTGLMEGGQCTADTESQPAERHFDSQLTYDTLRNWVWMRGGLNQNCPGGHIPTTSFYHYNLTNGGTPAGSWHYQTTSTSYTNVESGGTLIHDPDDDILYAWGGSGSSFPVLLYCRTELNPSPGTLTANQTTAGCTVADDWAYFYPNQGAVNVSGTAVTRVSGESFPASLTSITIGGTSSENGVLYFVSSVTDGDHLVLSDSGGTVTGAKWFTHPLGWTASTALYDTETLAWYLFGGENQAGTIRYAETWKYIPRSKKFVRVAIGQTAPAVESGALPINRFAVAYSSSLHKFFLHHSTGTPSDWQYDPVADLYTQLTASGTGSTHGPIMSYDESTGSLVTYANVSGAGTPPEMWVGKLSSVSTPLTVQEALYPGDATGHTYSAAGGVARTNEPFSMGIPLADSAGIVDAQVLTLDGATAGQFRCLGTWPSGNCKWVKVDGVIATLPAGTTGTVTLGTDAGDFGGSDLATDNGSTITVATGAATFTVKKAHFNGLDVVDIGAIHVVLTTSTTYGVRGLMLTGPDPDATYPANVTCSPDTGGSACTTVYASDRDASSSCAIEENGPVLAVLRCYGNLVDADANVYMHHITRMYFSKGQTYVKVVPVLRNADYASATDSAGNTFNSAVKGFESVEFRIAANITGTLNYTISVDSTACTAGVCTGTLNGSTDFAYIYQGRSYRQAQQSDCNATCADTLTPDLGYIAKKNTTTLASNGDGTATPKAFYADIADSSGVGIEIGVHEGGSQWPKSLEFQTGGADVRIGLWPGYNSVPTYLAWPTWNIQPPVFLNFHASAPASLANSFLKLQHPLLLRAGRAYYNTTGVFPYPMPDATEESAFYAATWESATYADESRPLSGYACCTADIGSENTSLWPLQVYRYKYWPNSGPSNQEEFRWSNLQRFLRAGESGRFLDSANFYRMEAGSSWPHADGASSTDSTANNFNWRDQTGDLDGFGRPDFACSGYGPGDGCATIQNAAKSFTNWFDSLHFHWWGITDYYFLTGDETIREAITPVKDWYMNSNTFQGGATISGQPGIGIIRGIGIEMLSAAHLADYLRAIGDSDYTDVLAQGVTNFTSFIEPEGCMNSLPTGCTMPPTEPDWPYTYPDPDPPGVNRQRGAPASTAGRGPGRCTAAANNGGVGSKAYRGISSFYASLLIEGLLAIGNSKGTSWDHYTVARDLAYGVSQWAFAEQFHDDGGAYFYKGGGISPTRSQDSFYNGFAYSDTFDVPYECPDGTPVVAGVSAQYSVDGPVFDLLQGSVLPLQGMFMNFYIQKLVNGVLTASQIRQIKIAMAWIRSQQGQNAADFGHYQLGSLIESIEDPSATSLQDVSFSLSDLGSGNYRLSWTEPAGCVSHRIKWSPKIIAPSTGLLGYDPVINGTFTLNPSTYSTWFGANAVSDPACGSGAQTFDVDTTGVTGLTEANFSLKAMYTTGAATPTAPTITSTSPLTSGTAGTAYSRQLTATGDATITWEVTTGTPPSGLSLSSGGLLSGTPTTAETQVFDVTATNDAGNDVAEFSLTIEEPAAPVGTSRIIRGRVTLRGRVIQ